ncbi:10468_t:CDS:2, partial [Acaulospora colombiana]
SWKLTLVIFCLVPLVAITSSIMNKLTARYMTRSLDFYSVAGTIAEEAISSIRTVMAFGSQKKLSQLYEVHLKDAKVEGKKKSIVNGVMMGVTFFFIYCTYALTFWYGSKSVADGSLTPGQVTNVFFAVIIGAFALGNLTPDLQSFSFAVSAGSKIFETIRRVPPIDVASEAGEKLESVKGHIRLENVTFIYPSRPEVRTLSNVSLDIEPGTTVALVGSSGSGKSTIISLVLRFYDPVAGRVLLDGHDI